jgi:ribosomal protein L37AE/L43A
MSAIIWICNQCEFSSRNGTMVGQHHADKGHTFRTEEVGA